MYVSVFARVNIHIHNIVWIWQPFMIANVDRQLHGGGAVEGREEEWKRHIGEKTVRQMSKLLLNFTVSHLSRD